MTSPLGVSYRSPLGVHFRSPLGIRGRGATGLTFFRAQHGLFNIVGNWDGIATADAFITDAYEGDEGACGTLWIGAMVGYIERSFVKFDLSAFSTPVSSVLTATLKLTLNQTISGRQNISAARVNKDWGEGSACSTSPTTGAVSWSYAKHTSSAWSTAGCGSVAADREAVAVASSTDPNGVANAVISMDVKDIVEDWLVDEASNYGLILISDDEGDTSDNLVYFKDRGVSGKEPTLEITYVP